MGNTGTKLLNARPQNHFYHILISLFIKYIKFIKIDSRLNRYNFGTVKAHTTPLLINILFSETVPYIHICIFALDRVVPNLQISLLFSTGGIITVTFLCLFSYLNIYVHIGSCYFKNSSLFTCNNGNCINKALKCDRSNNCGDNSDEFGCGKGAMCVKNKYVPQLLMVTIQRCLKWA